MGRGNWLSKCRETCEDRGRDNLLTHASASHRIYFSQNASGGGSVGDDDIVEPDLEEEEASEPEAEKEEEET